MATEFNIFDEVNRLCDQWERTAGHLPPDARHLLTKLAREIVLHAAGVCKSRGSVEERTIGIRNEANKCAAGICHALLCHHGVEECCLNCDGGGCERCDQRGIRTLSAETQALFARAGGTAP